MSVVDLPAEVLCLVLELAASSLPLTGDYSRSSFLLDTSLVCRAFRWPAQSTLLGTVRLATQTTATKWLATTHGEVEYPTWDLEMRGILGGKSGVSATIASRVLFKAFGVRRLELRDFGRLSVRCLQNAGLSRLSCLHLLTAFPDKGSVILSLNLPFQLRSLHLYNSRYPPELITMLLRASSHTLSTLTLSLLQSAPAYPALVASFPLISSTLTFLHINHRPSPAFVLALSRCTALRHLSCNSTVDLNAVLDSIQSQLQSLAIELDYHLEETLRTLAGKMGAPALASLRRLDVKVLIEGVGTRLDDLRTECARREIRLEVEARA